MIQWVLEEICESGIPRAAVVVSPAKPSLTSFLRRWRRGAELRISLIEQPRPAGLADALLRARRLAGGAPFAMVLPDNLFFPSRGAPGALAQVLEAFRRTGTDTCGLIRVGSDRASQFSHAGLVEVSRRSLRPHLITKLHGKRKGALRIAEGRVAYKTFARAVLRPSFFDYLERTAAGRIGSDEVPALQMMVRDRGLDGKVLSGRGFDAGAPRGYAAAIEYWSRRVSQRGHPTK
jgi:UTP--glucose-1-phosphate uridylyltransferase